MRKKKLDWLEMGLEVLAEAGPAELTIDMLIGRLGVTKGSFYHHFRNRRAFSEALLAYWEQRHTLDLIAESERAGAALDKILRLNKMVEERGRVRLEAAIRSWALQDPLARGFQERVDRARMGYCRKLAAELTGSQSEGHALGTLIYTSFLGGQHLLPRLSMAEQRAMQRFVLSRFADVPDRGEASPPPGALGKESGP